ncbi:hypothetical protein RJ640_029673 [Escallonia rubra]|uniref:Reverse transcriptase Ty1/copia-type domain-containing protein n=1 Tax=Escallonia rubra TaxID=112253 RepID=A0AA88R2K1_9ASTE|nr:hypothetical protein RJ640_029673 [Escallonia rubra]
MPTPLSEVWSDLQEHFTQGIAQRVFELKSAIALLQQEKTTISSYYGKLKSVWNELEVSNPIPVCTCGCICGAAKNMESMREEEKVYAFLISLDDIFNTVRSQILSIDPLPTLGRAYAIAAQEEKQQLVAATRTPPLEATTLLAQHVGDIQSMAFAATTGRRREKRIRENLAKTRCTQCGKPNHSKEQCYELVGYPANWSASRHRSVEVGTSAYMSDNFSGKTATEIPWVIDTGTTDHITGQPNILIDEIENLNITPIKIPNGDKVPVKFVGRDLPSGTLIGVAAISFADEPKSFSQAIKHSHWREAMAKEISALEENKTWVLTTLPPGKCAIESKWVYKVKYNPDGSIKRFKKSFVVVLIYVDDIVVTGNDSIRIATLKQYLDTQFRIKDLGKLKYFLGLKVARSSTGIVLRQRKYVLEILAETGMLGSKPSPFPMEQQHKLSKDSGTLLTDHERYRHIVGRLLYLTITRPDICYVVHILSQFMHTPRQPHLDVAFRVMHYLKNAPGQGIMFPSRNSLTLRIVTRIRRVVS